MFKLTYRGLHSRSLIRLSQVALVAPGVIIAALSPAVALDGSGPSTENGLPAAKFTSGQEALRLGEEDLRAGKIEASVVPLTYAAESGQVIARWKLGQMYAKGEGVPRDDSKAYHYFNQVVEGYDEDKPDLQNASAISDAFVAVGVYCLNGIPNSQVGADPHRAHELFQYAATTFADPNAQYNLAHMYMVGAGGLAKDNVAALRWLALAAKAGHPPSQAVLGHMLFVGNGVLDQRARGLMWLELAKDGATNPKGQWMRDLFERDFRDASDNERLADEGMRDARAKRLSSSPSARSSVTSFLQPFGVVPANR